MKKIIALLFSSCFFIIAHAQSQYFEYLNIQTKSQYATNAFETNSGNFIISATQTSDFNTNGTLKLIKLDNQGNLLIEKIIQSDSVNYSITQMIKQDTGFVAFGQSENIITNQKALWYAKFDNDLNLIEEKKHYFNEIDAITGNVTDAENNIIIVGYAINLTGQFFLPFIIKLDSQGDLVYSDFYINEVTSIVTDIEINEDSTGYVLFGGDLIVLDSTFQLAYSHPMPFLLNRQGNIKRYQDSLYLIAGKQRRNYPNFSFIEDIGIGLISSDFSPKSNDYFGLTDTTDFSAIFETMDYHQNTIYCGGNANIDLMNYPISDHTSHFVLAQYDENLNRQWLNYYGGDAYYVMFSLLATSDGGCLMVGHRYDFNVAERLDLYVLKVDANGNAVTSTSIPIEAAIEVNIYPNPFTDYFQLSTTLNKNLDFKFFNAAGQIIRATSFYNDLEINDLENAAKGVYFYTIADENRILKSGKLVKQ